MAATLPVLTFHAIDNRPSVIAFPTRLFDTGVRRLFDSGFRTLRLGEAADCVRDGVPFPDRALAISFDDGYRSVYREAFPVLQQYGMSATVFLTVGDPDDAGTGARLPAMEGREMLAWNEIQEMHRWGIDFGAHTLTHPDLTRLPRARAEAEICTSKATIEDALGAEVTSFAYPFGRSDSDTREIVRRNFACAWSDKLDLLNGRSDLYALERVDAYYLRSERLFALMPTRLFPAYLRGRGILRDIRRAAGRPV